MNGLRGTEPVVEPVRILGGHGGEEIELEGLGSGCLAHGR